MDEQNKKQSWGRRVNRWLEEAPGETFKDGKWRFWFPMLIGFSLLNAGLTALIFKSGENYTGAIMLSVGALLAWLCIGTLHYCDSKDTKLARGVSLLDSVTLVFVIAHFCFLLYVQGHIWTLRGAETKYEASAVAYNDKAEKVSTDNVKIAEAIAKVSDNERQRAKIENDTAYQQRIAAQSGAKIGARLGGSQSAAASLSTSPIELEKPEKPKESSTDFLTRWDFWIRLANFGELALAAVTFIFIRNRSAQFNAARASRDDEDFPSELDADVSVRADSKAPRLTAAKTPATAQTLVSLKNGDTDTLKTQTQTVNEEGL